MWEKSDQKIFSFLLSSSGNLDMLIALERLGRAEIDEWMREVEEEDRSTFRKRLEELMNYGLISKVVEGDDVRKEYYYLTPRGEGFLEFIKSAKKSSEK